MLADEVEEGIAVLSEFFWADAVDVGQVGRSLGGGGGEGVEGFLGEEVIGRDASGGGLSGAPGAEGFEEFGAGGGGEALSMAAAVCLCGGPFLPPRAARGHVEGGRGAGGQHALDVKAVGAGLDAGEFDAGFGFGFFAEVEELAAEGLVIEVEVGAGQELEDFVEELVLEVAGGTEAFAEGGMGLGVGVFCQQAVNLAEGISPRRRRGRFARCRAGGRKSSLRPGRRLPRWRSASSSRALR